MPGSAVCDDHAAVQVPVVGHDARSGKEKVLILGLGRGTGTQGNISLDMIFIRIANRSGTLPLSKPETTSDRSTLHLPLYKVLLHNDDHNTMEHVIKALIRVFNFERTECERIMIEAHRNGMALCTVEPLEKAEHHRDHLASFSLISTLEPE